MMLRAFARSAAAAAGTVVGLVAGGVVVMVAADGIDQLEDQLRRRLVDVDPDAAVTVQLYGVEPEGEAQ